MNRDTKKYLKEVRAEIPCSFRKKKQLMHTFLTSLENYLCDNPDASYQDIVDAFGTPKEMAETISENISDAEIQRYQKFKKFIFVTFVLLVCFLAVWAIIKIQNTSTTLNVVRTIIIE